MDIKWCDELLKDTTSQCGSAEIHTSNQRSRYTSNK